MTRLLATLLLLVGPPVVLFSILAPKAALAWGRDTFLAAAAVCWTYIVPSSTTTMQYFASYGCPNSTGLFATAGRCFDVPAWQFRDHAVLASNIMPMTFQCFLVLHRTLLLLLVLLLLAIPCLLRWRRTLVWDISTRWDGRR